MLVANGLLNLIPSGFASFEERVRDAFGACRRVERGTTNVVAVTLAYLPCPWLGVRWSERRERM